MNPFLFSRKAFIFKQRNPCRFREQFADSIFPLTIAGFRECSLISLSLSSVKDGNPKPRGGYIPVSSRPRSGVLGGLWTGFVKFLSARDSILFPPAPVCASDSVRIFAWLWFIFSGWSGNVSVWSCNLGDELVLSETLLDFEKEDWRDAREIDIEYNTSVFTNTCIEDSE